MQALASKATTALGVALGLMLTLLGGIALIGLGCFCQQESASFDREKARQFG